MQKIFELAYSFDDVLLVPKFSRINSRSEVDLSTQITPNIKIENPLISSNMSSITNAKFAVALGKAGGLGVIPRFASVEEEAKEVAKVKKENVMVGAAVGVKEGNTKRAELLVKAGVDLLVLDVAHGHMLQAIEMTKMLKQIFKDQVGLVSGNAATYEAANDLFNAGADCVKVGVGPGSTCITRTQTGCGVPQITAVLECARAAKKHNKSLICDGGMKTSGDVVKGLAAGASAVMTGHLFAGIKETAGKTIIKNGVTYKEYNGSTSLAEKEKRSAEAVKHIEGVESFVPYKGDLNTNLKDMLDNIRSGLSYTGSYNIKELWKNARFIKVSPLGFKENGAHDVNVKMVY